MEWGWLMWLQEKLPNGIVCVWKGPNKESGFYYNFSTGEFIIKDWVIPAINECAQKKNVRFIVGIITLHVRGGNHANAFIFDIKEHVLTRFEPHGAVTSLHNMYDPDNLDHVIRRWLTTSQPTLGSWSYRPPVDYCKIPGPQSRESWRLVEEALQSIKVWGKTVRKEAKGFCAAWSLIYIHFRVANPDFTDQELYEYFGKLSDRELSMMIRQYAEFIVASINPILFTKASQDFQLGDYVEYPIPTGSLYGRLIEINGEKSVTWIVDRGPGKRIHFGPEYTPLSELSLVDEDDEPLIEMIDKALKIQAKNPRTGTKNYTSFVSKLYDACPDLKPTADEIKTITPTITVPIPTAKKPLHIGDYVQYEHGNSILYGRIMTITGGQILMWTVDRGPGTKIRFGPTDISLDRLTLVENPSLQQKIDTILHQQAKNPRTFNRDFSGRVKDLYMACPDMVTFDPKLCRKDAKHTGFIMFDITIKDQLSGRLPADSKDQMAFISAAWKNLSETRKEVWNTKTMECEKS